MKSNTSQKTNNGSGHTFVRNDRKVKVYIPANESDDENPDYLMAGISNSLLAGIIKGEIDIVKLAGKELGNRGFGLNGEWLGFKQAEAIISEYLNKKICLAFGFFISFFLLLK